MVARMVKRLLIRALAHTILVAADWAERSANWVAAHSEGNTELNAAMARFKRDSANARKLLEEVLRNG